MIQTETSNNMQISMAKAISVIFHPLFMPLYGLLVIFTAPTLFWYLPLKVKEIMFFIFLINNVLIPVSLIPFLRYWRIKSPTITDNRKERIIPLLSVTLLYSITAFILFRLQIPGFLKIYSFSITILVVVLFVINLQWRISLHSAGAGALTALVLVLSLKMSSGLPWFLASSVLISGLVLSSRLRLNKHNPVEVYAGFLTGFLILGSLIFILK